MLLNAATYGEGRESIIILHGLFGSSNNWRSIARELARQRTVVALDLRNHGDSPWSPIMTYGAMVGDVAETMQALGIVRPWVIGHSLGGKTAMELAVMSPDLLQGLIVVDIAPRAYPSAHDAILETLASVDPTHYDSRDAIDRDLAAGIDDAAVRQFLLTNLRRAEGGGYRWRINLEAIRAEYLHVAGSVGTHGRYYGPALFLSGGRSGYLTAEDEPSILKVFPRASFQRIDRAAHWVHADAPGEFVAAVSGFIDAQSPRG